MLSIIIPVFNGEKTLGDLLDSILKSDFNDYEIIVVDDCSKDNTVSIIRESGAKNIRLPARSGPAIARNTGAREAGGEILVFFDADIEIFPDTLGKIACKFRDNPQVKVLVGTYDEEPVNKGFFPRFKALWFNSLFNDNARQTDSLEGFCVAIDKAIFISSGGFNPEFTDSSAEDYELGCRLRQKHTLYFDSRIKVRHNFPGFRENARRFFRRTCDFIPLFLKQEKSSRGKALSRDGFVSLFATLSFLLLPLVFMHYRLAEILFIFFIINFIFFGMKFVRLAFYKEGIIFGLASILTYYVNGLIVGLAIIIGIFRYFLILK